MDLGYDWEQAFKVCGAPRAVVEFDGSLDVTFDQIARAVATYEEPGDYAEMSVVGLFELVDGRFIVVRAFCDTTGWDCQAGGSIEVAATEAAAIRWGLDESERSRLGLVLS